MQDLLNKVREFKRFDRTAAWVLGVNLVGMTLYIIFGTREFYVSLAGGTIRDWGAVLYLWAATWIMLFLPVVLVWILTGNRLRNAGFRIGDLRFGLGFLVIFVVAMALPLYLGGHDPRMLAEYPLYKGLSQANLMTIIGWEALYLLYYVAWEGTFRGIVMFAAARQMGMPAAILYHTAITVLLHYPKPPAEIFAALAGGVVFGLVAWRTRSWAWPLACHFFVGLVTDLVTMHG